MVYITYVYLIIYLFYTLNNDYKENDDEKGGVGAALIMKVTTLIRK